MTSLKKIAIFQTDLLVGGIQKSLLNFLNRFGGKDYLIDVYLFNEEKFYDVAKLPENIRSERGGEGKGVDLGWRRNIKKKKK